MHEVFQSLDAGTGGCSTSISSGMVRLQQPASSIGPYVVGFDKKVHRVLAVPVGITNNESKAFLVSVRTSKWTPFQGRR